MADFQLSFENNQALSPDMGASLAVQAMQREIDLHRAHDKSKSYLGAAINFAWRSDENRLSELEAFKKDTELRIANGTVGDVAKLEQKTREMIQRDQKAVGFQDEVNHYGGTLLKVGALFYGGRAGWAATGALYAADQANPHDSFGTQMLDGSLGAAKGLASKGVINAIGHQSWNFAAKGAAMGITNRIIDQGLTKETYMDGSTGEFSFGTGLSRIKDSSLNLRAVGTDIVVFGAAYGLGSVVSKLAPAVTESALMSTVATSATFGVTSGTVNEYERQRLAGEKIDWSQVALRGGLEGAVFALAAVPGGLQAEAKMNRIKEEIQMQRIFEKVNQLQEPRTVNIDGKMVKLLVGQETVFDGNKVIGSDLEGTYVNVAKGSRSANQLTVNGEAVTGKTYVQPADQIINVNADPKLSAKVILSYRMAEVAGGPALQYQKTGTVQAEKLTQAETWLNGKGETMEGAAGDYKVTQNGSSWTVKGSIFEKTYNAVEGKPGEFMKVPTIAQVLEGDIVVQTREGKGSGVKGDYLVTGPEGDQYVVTKAKFEGMYKPLVAPLLETLSVDQTTSLYEKLKAAGREYTFEKRQYEATVRPAVEGETLTTIQGDVSTAKAGMMKVSRVMLNGSVDEYFIFPDKLTSRWVPASGQQPGEAGVYTPKPGGTTTMVELEGPLSIKPSWSNTPFTGNAGDFLASYGAGDFNIVHVPALADTYVGVNPASLLKSQAAVDFVKAQTAQK